MLARHSALFRLAYAKLAAHRLSKVRTNPGAGFATTRRNEGSSAAGGNRDGQSGMSFNRITTSTNIRDKILQSGSSEDLLRTVEQNAHLLNPANSAGALRALARFFPSNPRLGRELRADPNFQLLIEKVTSSIDQLEIGPISDFCQAIKRAEQRGISLGVKPEIFPKIQARLTEILNEKKYDDRSLFYIYFNGVDLNIGTDVIAKELVRIIREAPQQLTTQQIRNTLMALASKRGPLTGNETALALELDKVLPEYLSGIEPSNKARIFRDLAALEFQYIGPRYKISQSLNKIKVDLKEGLESFNEEDVLLILDAYHYLPATYPNDLLDIFKDVMSNTVVHNPAAVKSQFLVRYISQAGQLSRARRINPTALNGIFNLVASRLKTDPFMQREIEELCQYLLKINLSHQQLKTDIFNHLKTLQAESSNYFKVNCLEYIVRNSTPEANKGFVKELVNPEILSKLNTTSLRRVKAIIESLNDPDFAPILKKIEAEPEYSKLENIRTSLFTGGQRSKHHDEALQVVTSLFENLKTSGRNLNIQPMTTLLNTIHTRDTQNELIKRPELQNLTPPQIGAILSALFELEAPNDFQWTFVLEILKINTERVTVGRIISYLNNNGIKLNSIALRSPRIVQNWVNFLANLPKIEEERIGNLFPLLLRLSDAGIVNYKLIEKFRLNTERCLKEGIPINFTTLGAVTEFLVEHENCTFEIAQTLFEKSKTQKYVDKSRYRIIAYLYDRKQATPEQKANLQAVAEEEIKKLLTNLGSLDPKHVLEAASAVLMFPYPLIKDHLANLQAAVKDHIAYVTPNNFAELVKCLALSYRPRNELEHYQPLLRDIATHFSTFAPKLKTSELIEALEGFSYCNFKGANVYNTALTLVANIFSKIRISDLLRILDSFSHVQLKHQDLFEKIGERALEDLNRLEREDAETIIRSYLRVGYQGNLKHNPKLWELVLSKKVLYSQNNQLALYFIIVADHPSEAEMLKTYFDTVSTAKVASRKAPYTPTAHRVLAYLRAAYPNEPFAKQFEALLQEKPADFSKIECSQSELIRSYIRAIGAEFEDNYELDAGIEGIFLKGQNTFVQFWSRQALNYDFSSLRGLTVLGHKSNAALAKHKQINYISINLHELLIIPNDLDRVKYLTSKGIQPGKSAEEYDFSLITKKAVDKDEPAEAEAPEVAKKASRLESDSEPKVPATEPVESESSSEEEKPSSETSKTSPKKKGAEKATTKTS